jgi:hypothetical protein
MRYLASLHLASLAVLAALALAAPGAHAFTIENQGATSNYSVNNFGTLNNFGSTLTTPGQTRSVGDALSSTPGASTPGASTSGTGSQMGGFSFHVGPQSSFGAANMRPPAWSTNPLFLDRGQ